MKQYNKLVRDRILEIIEADGTKPQSRILDDAEYKKELAKKLVEESKEFLEAETEEELYKEIADVWEVIEYVIKAFQLDHAKIMEVNQNRHDKRGGFEKKIFLESTDEN